MYWYMTCRYYGGVDIWYPSLGRQMYRIGSRQYWWGLGIYQWCYIWCIGSPSLTRYGSIYGILAWQGVGYYSSSTLLGTTCTYYTALPCLETSYNIPLHIATWWDTSIYILVVIHTLVYHLLRHSTTYTLVILAIYCWGSTNTNMLPTTDISLHSTNILHVHIYISSKA